MSETDVDAGVTKTSADADIVVRNLTKYYGDVKGNEDVSFDVYDGEIFGFLGPNGAGKSTTIRLLLGFLKPDSGDIRLLGRDVLDSDELVGVKRHVGYVPSEFTFHESLTGDTVLDYFESMRGGERRDELASLFTPPLGREIGEYSTGNKQKLALVQAFMHDPELVFMDEPTSGLDPSMQGEVYDFLLEEADNGKTIFFSSHILSEVEKIADRVGVIRDGEMVGTEDIDEVISMSGKVLTIEFADSVGVSEYEMEGVDEIDEEPPVEGGETRVSMVATGNYDALLKRIARHEVVDMSVRETTLEEVFMHYYD
ncbi:MAG: ABC transporter ATP-binding protein [Halobacteriales archaeon]|nr:ABC transporter ATP-binding protein [Halobacteriales archaeon]